AHLTEGCPLLRHLRGRDQILIALVKLRDDLLVTPAPRVVGRVRRARPAHAREQQTARQRRARHPPPQTRPCAVCHVPPPRCSTFNLIVRSGSSSSWMG